VRCVIYVNVSDSDKGCDLTEHSQDGLVADDLGSWLEGNRGSMAERGQGSQGSHCETDLEDCSGSPWAALTENHLDSPPNECRSILQEWILNDRAACSLMEARVDALVVLAGGEEMGRTEIQ